jgi:hypothetical protein
MEFYQIDRRLYVGLARSQNVDALMRVVYEALGSFDAEKAAAFLLRFLPILVDEPGFDLPSFLLDSRGRKECLSARIIRRCIDEVIAGVEESMPVLNVACCATFLMAARAQNLTNWHMLVADVGTRAVPFLTGLVQHVADGGRDASVLAVLGLLAVHPNGFGGAIRPHAGLFAGDPDVFAIFVSQVLAEQNWTDQSSAEMVERIALTWLRERP